MLPQELAPFTLHFALKTQELDQMDVLSGFYAKFRPNQEKIW